MCALSSGSFLLSRVGRCPQLTLTQTRPSVGTEQWLHPSPDRDFWVHPLVSQAEELGVIPLAQLQTPEGNVKMELKKGFSITPRFL